MSDLRERALRPECVLKLLGNGSHLLHSVLVGRQVALEGLVSSQQRSDLCQRGRLVVLLRQVHLLT